jgi:transcription antitermination factor NusG
MVSAVLANVPASWQEPRWYVLSVRSRQEKRVTEHLRGRGVEHYLPCYSSLRKWKDRRVTLQMPLFPGYVFVRLALLERMKVLTVPHIVSLVGSGNVPSEISAQEIDSVRRAEEHAHVEPHPYLKEGQHVVITTGVMAGMQGILLRRQNGARVVVCLDSISRAFVVEVDTACLEPLSAPARPELQRAARHA